MKQDTSAAVAAPERTAALQRTGLLDTPPEESFDRLARLACRLLNAPVALVSLVDADRQFFKSQCGLPEPWASSRETPLSHSVCRHVVDTGMPLVIDDTREHELVRGTLAVEELGVVAYAGIPLVAPDGAVVGSFCVIDRQPRHWTDEQVGALSDLAASVQTEIRLRETVATAHRQGAEEERIRQQFEELVQGIDVIVWEADLQVGFTFVSQHAEALLGYPARRWIDEPTFWSDVLIHPDDRQAVVDLCQTATAAGQNHDFEYRAVRADGGELWLREIVRVEPGADGSPRYLRGLMIDITAQKIAAEKLRKREAQLAQAQLVARMGGWEHDLIADRVTWSDETYRVCGLEPQSVEPSLEMLVEMVHPDDRARLRDAVGHTLKTGEPYCVDIRLMLADGTVRHIQSRGEAVIDATGRVVRLHGVGQDITDRVQAEQDAQAMARRMHAVASAAAGVIGAESIDALLPVLRDACQQVISLDAFWLSLYDEATHTFAYAGYDLDQPISTQTVGATGIPSERVLRTQRSIVTHRSSDPDAAGGIVLGTQRRSESIIRTPILSGSRVMGVISVQSYTPELYSAQDVEVLEAIAALTATALLNLELLEDLRTSEESYRAIFEASGDAIYVLDKDTGAILDVNAAACALNGYPPEQMKALGIGGLSYDRPPHSWENAQELIRRAAAGEPQRVDWLARHCCGRDVWGEVTLQRVNILGEDRVLATARDITERRAAEQARQQAERDAQAMASRMRAVAGAAAGVIGAESVDTLQDVLREECRRVMPFDAFTLALYDEVEHSLAYLEGFDTDLWIPAETISAAGTPAERVIRTRRSLVSHRSDDPEAAGAQLMGTGRRSESIIRTPILSGNRVMGVISVQSYTPDLYSAQDVEVLEAIASLTATALLNLELLADRKAAAAALGHSESKFKALFEKSPDPIFLLDGKVFIDCNQAAVELMRCTSKEQILGRHPAELSAGFQPGGSESFGAADALMQTAFAQGSVVFEWLIQRADGEIFPAEVAMTAYPLQDGQVLHVVARDITARKRAEEALLRANEELEQRVAERTEQLQQRTAEMEGVFRALPDLFFRLSPEATVLPHRSELDARLYQAPPQFVGRSLSDMLAAVLENEADRARIREAVQRIQRTGEVVSVEYPMPTDDGTREFEARLVRLDDGSMIAVARDITDRVAAEQELKKREEHFRRLIENAHDFVEIVDLDGTTRYISPAVQRILGYSPEELIGTAGILLADPAELEAGRAKLIEAAANPGTTIPGEFRVLHKDGSTHVLETFARTLAPASADEGIVINARDITDRKGFEDALQEREEWFRSLIEKAHDLVQVINPTGNTIYVSPSVERILGYAPEELVGTLALNLVHPDDLERGVAELAALASQPNSQAAGEFRLRHKDGSYRLVESFGRFVSPDAPERGIVINSRDITERKGFEDALQERETRFRRLTENSSDLVQIIYADGSMGYTGPSVVHLLGYTPEEIAGISILEFIHPDDLEAAREALDAVMRLPGVSRSLRYRVRHKDGRWRMFEAYGRTLLPDSAEEGMVCNARDITERHEAEEALRRSEEHFRRLIENAHDLVMVIDPAARIDYISPSVQRILGFAPEELLGTPGFDLVHPEDIEIGQQGLGRTVEEPGTVTVTEIRLHHKDGGYRLVESVARTLSSDTTDAGVVINVRDITEHRKFEEVLRDSEARYRSLIENAHDIVTILDLEGRIVYQSPQLERVLGYDAAEMLGQSALEYVHPDDVEMPAEALHRILTAPSTTVTTEYRFLHKDSSWRYLETFGRALVPDSPEQGLVFNSRDVTERRETQRLLQEREEHFRRLIETSHDLIQTLDSQGQIVYTGPSVERLLGYTPEEIAGKGADDYIHPDDHPAVASKIVEALTNPGTMINLEYRVQHKDGRWRWFEAMGRTLAPDTAKLGMVANARDITERREAEQQIERQRAYFEQLLASVEAGISAWDPQCRFEYVSNNAVTDPEAREFIIGKTHAEYYAWCGKPQEVAAQRHHYVEQAIHTRRATEFEDPVELPDGTTGHMLRRYWPVFDGRGEVERVIGYSVDISERKRTEEALRHATEEADHAREAAERANRAKSEFLSRMSHELRTPMNSILGFAQLLDRAPLPPENKKGVGHILKAGRHLLQLINEVLEIARIEAGRHSLSLEPVRAGTVLQEAVALVRPLAAQWRVELDEGPWPCCGAFVQADRQRLTQVLLNLLANAIKYNRAGGRVGLSCDMVGEGDRQRLVLRVQDTGRGIDPNKADQLFTPFARLGAEQSEVEGTGLGLALSQRLAEAMGGALTLESTGPGGSVFRLDLQITADPLQRLEDPDAMPASLDDAPHAPATLLYIEDNLANLSLVETILLSRPQWRTMPALQGQIGVELAREHTPNLILLDLHLPDISGEEVLRRLRAEPKTASIPIVVITADATRTTVDRLRAAGADAYLTKPLDIDEFLETVERFLPSPE